MDEKERQRIEDLLGNADDDDIRPQLMLAAAEDALEATETGIGFISEELKEWAGIQQPERKYQKGQSALSSDQLKEAMIHLGRLLDSSRKEYRYWPNPVPHYPCDDQSERLLIEELHNLGQVLKDLNERKEFVEREFIIPIEKELKERTSYFNSLIELIEELVEKGPVGSKPKWDRNLGELRFRKKTIKTIVNLSTATNAVPILDEFQKEGWPDRIANPFKDTDEDKLKEGIRTLNKDLKKIKFSVRSKGVAWKEL